jgi:hypothetical protein
MVMQEEPGRFLYHLITDLRPLAPPLVETRRQVEAAGPKKR